MHYNRYNSLETENDMKIKLSFLEIALYCSPKYFYQNNKYKLFLSEMNR